MKKLIVILLFVSMLLLLTSCGSDKTEKLTDELIEAAVAENSECSEENVLTASVTIPDYSKYMLEVMDEAEKKAKDAEDYEKVLYSLVRERTKKKCDTVTHDVSIEMIYVDSEKKDWSDIELEELAKQKAFEIELEEFCAELLSMQEDFAAIEVENEK
ncbi:MAG: hypothetical protein IKU19_09195 [Clostridia bacterium]|nr:hypothetical protein [Clostridia bacterium]